MWRPHLQEMLGGTDLWRTIGILGSFTVALVALIFNRRDRKQVQTMPVGLEFGYHPWGDPPPPPVQTLFSPIEETSDAPNESDDTEGQEQG